MSAQPFIAATHADLDDPLAMYFVVRKDVALTLAQAMSLAGAGAVMCADEFRDSLTWAEPFALWHERSYRKVCLRADAKQFERLRAELDCVALADTLLCLPPMRKSARPPVLKRLQAYTDARQPDVAPAPAVDMLMRYIIRADAMKSTGKAMAQAGHAALMCADAFADSHPDTLNSWRENRMAAEVLLATDEQWETIKTLIECVVVTDAGFTQVQAGTETVLALLPAVNPVPAVATLQRVI